MKCLIHIVLGWKGMVKCKFSSIEDQFNFWRYNGLSLADVLDINPSYLNWCVIYCTSVVFQLEDNALNEIKIVYPNFIIDNLFEEKRIWQLSRINCNDYYSCDDYEEGDSIDNWNVFGSNFEDSSSYGRYSGSWAQDVEGYSDDDIEIIFDGDPNAYWNID